MEILRGLQVVHYMMNSLEKQQTLLQKKHRWKQIYQFTLSIHYLLLCKAKEKRGVNVPSF